MSMCCDSRDLKLGTIRTLQPDTDETLWAGANCCSNLFICSHARMGRSFTESSKRKTFNFKGVKNVQSEVGPLSGMSHKKNSFLLK